MIKSWLVLAVLITGSAAGSRAIVPRDEAAGDSSFGAFRAELRAVAQSCEQAKLWALFVDDFEGPESRRGLPQTRAYFEMQQRDEGAASLPLCRELARALALGATIRSSGYCVPYALCQYDDADVWGEDENGSAVVAAGADVAVRERPLDSAPVVDTLHYEVVKSCRYWPHRPCEGVADQAAGWYAIISPRDKVGYVRAEDILVPRGDLQFVMARRPEGWRVVSAFSWE